MSLDMPPYFDGDNADTIHERILADVRARGFDVQQGSVEWDISRASALQVYGVGVVRAFAVDQNMFLRTATPAKLPDHGVHYDIRRNLAQPAAASLAFAGTNGTPIPFGTRVATAGDSGVAAIIFETTAGGVIAGGSATVTATSLVSGAAANVAAGTVRFPVQSLAGVSSVVNPAPATGGADDESWEDYRQRLMLAAAVDPGMATRSYYQLLALSVPGVTSAYVQSNYPDWGYVRVVIEPPELVATVQAALDAAPLGDGNEQSEIAHAVTVVATVTVAIDFVIPALVADETAGYTLAQARANAEADLAVYLASLNESDPMRIRDAEANVIEAPGVLDIGDMTARREAEVYARANVSLAANERATLGTVTYT